MNPLFVIIGGALLLAAIAIATIVSVLEIWYDKCPHCGSRRVVTDEEAQDKLRCLECNSTWRP